MVDDPCCRVLLRSADTLLTFAVYVCSALEYFVKNPTKIGTAESAGESIPGHTLSVDPVHLTRPCDSHVRKTAGGGRDSLLPNARAEEDIEGRWSCWMSVQGRGFHSLLFIELSTVAMILDCCLQPGGGRNKRFKKTKKQNTGEGAQKRPREDAEAAPAKRAKTE